MYLYKKTLTTLTFASLLIWAILIPQIGKSQQVIEYGFDHYQKLGTLLNSVDTRFHTSLKPMLLDDVSLIELDSALRIGKGKKYESWVMRKVFNEHLIEVNKEDYTFYADFLPDLSIGKDFSGKTSTWLNTRGFQAGGTIGKKFSFYTSGFENQGRFANYYADYIMRTKTVPGQTYNRNDYSQKLTKDWSYVTALISYTPNKYLNISLGNDKNFVGDGYRSMFLSDNSAPYTFLRLVGTLGNVRYMALYASMQDPSAPRYSYDIAYRKKGGVFHYLDWNVNNRLSIGFFEGLVYAESDDKGFKRGFDWSYISPIIFLRPLEASNGSPDNAVLGFNSKYKFSKSLVAYGQFSLDEFESSTFFSNKGSSRTKFGAQIGIKGSDVFKIDGLTYLLEYNMAKPYTYSETEQIINYANYNEPLAHPFGANFREIVGLAAYSYRKFDFNTQVLYSKYGLDRLGENNGKNIFLPYTYNVTPEGNFTTQGIRTDLFYLEGKVSYILNPKYNLRFELGGLYRKESNELGRNTTGMITFGLRSSFRNLYHDF